MRLTMTAERVETIQQMCREGFKPAEISRATGISESSCRRFSAGVVSGRPNGLVAAARARDERRKLRKRLGPFTEAQMRIALNVLEVSK
jgi:hypothetical protein